MVFVGRVYAHALTQHLNQLAFARHASNSVGHFISVISNVTTLVKYTRSRTFYIKYDYILIPVKDPEDRSTSADRAGFNSPLYR